jgi:predicted AAA+ superfamily ATPase
MKKCVVLHFFKGKSVTTYIFLKESILYKLDFVIQQENQIIPVEVKAEENLKAKSLKVFEEKFKTNHAIRCSMSKYREEDWLKNIPLYAVMLI